MPIMEIVSICPKQEQAALALPDQAFSDDGAIAVCLPRPSLEERVQMI